MQTNNEIRKNAIEKAYAEFREIALPLEERMREAFDAYNEIMAPLREANAAAYQVYQDKYNQIQAVYNERERMHPDKTEPANSIPITKRDPGF